MSKIYPIKPLKDNLLILPLEKDKVSPGGVILPNTKVKDSYRKGVVLAKGDGMSTEMDNGNSQIPEWINVGDIILFTAVEGWDINFDSNKYVVVSWRQVQAMIDPAYVAEQKS